MSLETELKKIAINLQQLTDAVVTHTAALQAMQPPIITGVTAVVDVVETPAPDGQVQMGADAPSGVSGMAADTVITDEVVTEPVDKPVDATVVDIHKNTEAVVTGMTMAQANLELQGIVGQMADGGEGVRDLLKRHNAITLAQIAPENYESFVEEARGLITANQA